MCLNCDRARAVVSHALAMRRALSVRLFPFREVTPVNAFGHVANIVFRWSSGASLSGGLVALDGDLACTCTHLRGVVPSLHPQQHVHAHVKGLFDA